MDLNELMDIWEKEHKEKRYQRFIRDGIVCEKQWTEQDTPKVCFFLKEAYTSEENGYNLAEDLRKHQPWSMWRKVAIWTQAIHNAFKGEFEYNNSELRSREKEVIDSIAVVNVKKSNGSSSSNYEDLKKYAEEDKDKLKQQLELIKPDIILCGNNFSLLKIVLGNELEDDDTWDTMLAMWKDTLVIDYYHPAVQYPNRVNYYALHAICKAAIKKYGL